MEEWEAMKRRVEMTDAERHDDAVDQLGWIRVIRQAEGGKDTGPLAERILGQSITRMGERLIGDFLDRHIFKTNEGAPAWEGERQRIVDAILLRAASEADLEAVGMALTTYRAMLQRGRPKTPAYVRSRGREHDAVEEYRVIRRLRVTPPYGPTDVQPPDPSSEASVVEYVAKKYGVTTDAVRQLRDQRSSKRERNL